MIARNDDEATRGARRPRGGDQLHAEAAKSVMKGVLIASLKLKAAERSRGGGAKTLCAHDIRKISYLISNKR